MKSRVKMNNQVPYSWCYYVLLGWTFLAVNAFAVESSQNINAASSSCSNNDEIAVEGPLPHPPMEVWANLVVGGKEDEALGHVEQLQASTNRPYGRVLDAGTGVYSLRWLAGLLHRYSDPKHPLHLSRFVAVTADETLRKETQQEADSLGVSSRASIVIGNWAQGIDDNNNDDGNMLCAGDLYDTILAEYLVGAIDHFAPYFQDRIFPRLVHHLKPGGRMYVMGLNPIPDSSDEPGADLFCRLTKLRDACILLTGSRPYREYPPDWIERHLQAAGLHIIDSAKFTNTYDIHKVQRQIEAARSTLQFITDDNLKQVMSDQIDALEQESKDLFDNKLPNGTFDLGFDWVISAELPIQQ